MPVQITNWLNSSVGVWMNLTVCPLCDPSLLPAHGEVFQWIFYPADHTPPIHTHWHHTACGNIGGRSNTNYGYAMVAKKMTHSFSIPVGVASLVVRVSIGIMSETVLKPND